MFAVFTTARVLIGLDGTFIHLILLGLLSVTWKYVRKLMTKRKNENDKQ